MRSTKTTSSTSEQIPGRLYSSDLEDLVRAPYVRGGRSLETGIDCFGILLEIAHRAGEDLRDPRGTTFDELVGWWSETWEKLPDGAVLEDLDVLYIDTAEEVSVLTYAAERLWGASEALGVYCLDLDRGGRLASAHGASYYRRTR